jgi:hypothetical protein
MHGRMDVSWTPSCYYLGHMRGIHVAFTFLYEQPSESWRRVTHYKRTCCRSASETGPLWPGLSTYWEASWTRCRYDCESVWRKGAQTAFWALCSGKDFFWMGFGFGLKSVNNWNPWIVPAGCHCFACGEERQPRR